MTIRVGIIGAAGYAAGELLRVLLAHPHAHISVLTSESSAGEPVSRAFPGLRLARERGLCFEKFDLEDVLTRVDVVFLAQESGKAMQVAAAFLEKGIKVIDLSADFRLHEQAIFEKWYKHPHVAPQLLPQAVYGLPELYREKLATASLIANPGCYPTATSLALAPLLENRCIVTNSIVIDAKSGVSGAGRAKHTLDYHFPELNESMKAYGVGGTHRHTPEIEQVLSGVVQEKLLVSFTPHLIPITRGMLVTASAVLSKEMSALDVRELFLSRYASEPFVVVRELGDLPTTKDVVGGNECHVSIFVDERIKRVTVISVIDNVMKGAASQAVQNMNICFGLKETAGLDLQGMWP